MVNMSQYIRNKKEQFLSVRSANKERLLKQEVQTLKLEKERQAKLEKVNKEKAKLTTEVTKLKGYNTKASGPSRFQKVAEGLARLNNEVKKAAPDRKDVFGFNGPNAMVKPAVKEKYDEVVTIKTIKRNKPLKEMKKEKSPFNFG